MRLMTPAGAQTAAQLDGLITQQSLMIAYLDDFKAMFLITLAALPLLLLLRYKKLNMAAAKQSREEEPVMVMAD